VEILTTGEQGFFIDQDCFGMKPSIEEPNFKAILKTPSSQLLL
jgi:hypothetical protein